MSTLRDRLRAEPSIVGRPPHFDPAQAPADPLPLFDDWLQHALAARVPEPHALTLSTVDERGHPDARVLVLKDVTADGAFEIATGNESAKGRQLAVNPHVALTFYWTPLARSVRVRGIAAPASPDESSADFRARNLDAKSIALAGRQSAPLRDPAQRDQLVAASRTRLAAEPDLTSPGWTVWRISPNSIEFWQGERSRNHLRLRYDRTTDGWTHQQLWA